MTHQIAEGLQAALSPGGVDVVVEAEHKCMHLRGANSAVTTTITSSLCGTIRIDARPGPSP